jgi:SAM-dependent methyltransferase
LDWVGEEWLHYLDELGVGEMRERKHRKGWEWAQGLYALEKLGMLRHDAVAIGVGAGTEQFIFYLTNYINMVYATDIYGQGKFVNETAFADMVTAPERYSKIPFNRDRLVVKSMDGCDLKFPDNSFDFVFSFSSIEHFGGHERAQCAMKEMARVVKPFGVVVLTTEIVLNGVHHHEYFLPEQLLECCVHGTGLRLIEDIDFEISQETLEHVLDCRHPKYRTASPHVILKFAEVCWTSVSLVLEKK